MDPVSAAIIAAVASGAGKMADTVIIDAYEGLKELIIRKFGEDSELAKSVDSLETRPESAGRKTMVQEEVTNSVANQDPEILEAAQALLDQLQQQPDGAKFIQTATGTNIAQAAGNSTATVNLSQPKN